MSSTSKILLEFDDFYFVKIDPHTYSTSFSIKNKNIILPCIINFDLIKLIYELNPDIYEDVTLEKKENNEAYLKVIMKHFFEDLGLPQRYAYLHVKQTKTDEEITFEGVPITHIKPEGIPVNSEMVAVRKTKSCCKIISNHHIQFTHNIYFDRGFTMPPFIEKMIGIIINKIFKRVKLFIEKITVN